MSGIDINHQNSDFQTALHLTAAESVIIDITNLLAYANADLDMQDYQGCTALHRCIQNGRILCVLQCAC